MIKWTKLVISAALLIVINFSLQAQEERHIHVNGEHLDAEDITLMDQLFDAKVANGFYWINFQTGQWGYENSPDVMGINQNILKIAQAAQKAQQQNQHRNQNNKTIINRSQNGSVVSGKLNGRNCTFVSVGGTTVKSCD